MRIEQTVPIIASGSHLKTGSLGEPNDSRPETLAVQGTTVSISGQALLRQRLFCSDPNVEPAMPDIKHDPMVLRPLLYLNKDDRQLLGDIYEFAQAEGLDLVYVDSLGHSLAEFRGSEDGKRRSPLNQGKEFDWEGHMVSYSFTDKDAVIAERIRNSSALPSTRLDKAFIAYETDKNHTAICHSEFDFLELVVTHFSNAPQAVPIDGRFQKHEYIKNNFVRHVSKEVYEHMIFPKGDKPDKTAEGPDATAANPVPEFEQALTLRQAIHKYLQQNAIPTLFQTIARLRR